MYCFDERCWNGNLQVPLLLCSGGIGVLNALLYLTLSKVRI